MRGYEERNKIKINIQNNNNTNRDKKFTLKTKDSTKDIKIIIPYSDKKIKANFNPPYSTLNPLTNSDSPSDKSKGERLTSQTKDRIKIK